MSQPTFPIKTPFFPDTKAGVDHFTKTLKEDQSTTPAKAKEIDKLGVMMKRSVLDYHIKSVKKFDSHDASTYPSRPEVRGKLLEIEKLEKDLEPTKKRPSTWDIIYQSMTPIEKGQWNSEQRRNKQERLKEEQEDQESDQDLTKTIPNEVNQIMNSEIESIRKMRMDAEKIRELPERRLEIKKTIPAGLHETFTQDKLLEGSILRQIKEDNEKI
tara:strand:- start:482 stop:1123 length:642 start_codon:yes stop_codon:yes gene_type:complete